jgi:hypothetical protein
VTTIATDGKTVASDSRRCAGSELIDECTVKIKTVGGTTYAITGTFACFLAAIEWHQKGAIPGDQPKGTEKDYWTLLVMTEDAVDKYSHDLPYSDPFPYPQAFGSGASYAMAALKMGKSPREAIEVAKQLDIHTGGPVQEITIRHALSEAAE